MNPSLPLSVVITAISGPELLTRALASLEDQENGIAAEVLVLLREPETLLDASFPANVTLVPCGRDEGIPEMRARGIRLARGEIIVVTKDECVFPPDWLGSLARAHASFGSEAIGGGVENAANRRLVDRAIHLLEYAAFIHPAPDGLVGNLPASNVSYKRTALERLPSDLMRDGYWETIVHQEIIRQGGEVRSVSTLRVVQGKEGSFREIWLRRLRYGRAFAARRCRDAPPFWRVLYAAGCAVLPAVFVWRTVRRTLRHPGHIGELVITLPLITVFATAASFGEFVGAIAGEGKSGNNFA